MSNNPFADVEKPRPAAIASDITTGIHEGVPAETYFTWDAASNSRLQDLARSPAYCRERIQHRDEGTPVTVDGTATHCAFLEPGEFEGRYVVVDVCEAVKKDGSACGNTANRVVGGKGYCGVKGHAPGNADDSRIALSAEQMGAIEGRIASARALPRVTKLLDSLVYREVSILWTDALSGMPCKARIDGIANIGGRLVLLDLKRTKDAHPDDFPRAMFNFGIHRQLAWYRRGCAAVGLDVADSVVLAVHDDAPYEAYLYRPLDAVLTFGARENGKALALYAECVRSGLWPAGPDKVLSVDLPEWAKQRMAAEDFNDTGDST